MTRALNALVGCLALLVVGTSSAGPNDQANPLAQRIDLAIRQRLDAEKVPSSPIAGDAEFLRRVSLDITGVIPTPEKAAAFLDSKDPDKRARLIDELLASPRYGGHMADLWQDLIVPHSSDVRRLQSEPLHAWLTDHFNKNTPWDRLVSDLLTSSGTQDKNGAVTFFLANSTPDKMTDQVSRLFLGVQLQCAQCHNHPFTKWKQTEYWGMAAFFLKVRPDNVNKAAKQGDSPGISEGGGRRGGKNVLPESAKIVPPKFFQGPEPKLSASEPYRPVFARWLTAADNPFFARAMVNRVWAQFFGRGLVHPVDDLREDNPASHPELLQDLAGQFVAGGYDVKALIRSICNSPAYQRTSRPVPGNESDVALLSHMAIKPLAPEQLYDSLAQVVGTPAGRGAGRKGGKGAPGGPREAFLNFFRVEDGGDPTEYPAGIPQVLRLMNSDQLNHGSALLDRSGSPAQIIERLYLATLSRRPTEAEQRRTWEYVRTHPGKPYQDVLWVLLNTSEFTLNH